VVRSLVIIFGEHGVEEGELLPEGSSHRSGALDNVSGGQVLVLGSLDEGGHTDTIHQVEGCVKSGFCVSRLFSL
jgi:hypothetical protein